MTHSRRWIGLAGLVLALTIAVLDTTAVAAAGGPPQNRGLGMGQNVAVTGELDAEEQAILAEFLIDEHKALAIYETIMADFGEVAPFTAIARAERNHIAALERIYTRYSIDLPAIPTFDIPSFTSIEGAAAAAVQAEVDNAALYDRLLSGIDNADVVRVATNLRNASLNNHLPALQTVVDGTFVEGGCTPRQLQNGGTNAGTMRARGRGARGAAQSGAAGNRGTRTQLRQADATCTGNRLRRNQ